MTITLHAWHALVALLVVGLLMLRWSVYRPPESGGTDRGAAIGMWGFILALFALGPLIGSLIGRLIP
jgi:hypothetical protein